MMNQKQFNKLSPEQRIEHFNNRLPEEPFIAVFGSSHTWGSCKHVVDGEERTELPVQHQWTHMLQRDSGYPVVNFGKPGIDNQTMIMMLAEFFRLERSANCIHVITEIRFNEASFSFSHDMPIQFDHELPQFYKSISLEEGCIMHETLASSKFSQVKDAHTIMEIANNRFVFGKHGKSPRQMLEPYLSRVNAAMGDNKNIVDSMEEYLYSHGKLKFNTLNHVMKSHTEILSLQESVLGRGIKFNWFCWDLKYRGKILKPQIVTELNLMLEKYYPYLVEHQVKGCPDGMIIAYVKTMGVDGQKIDSQFDLPTCDCGHYKRPVQEFVKNHVIKHIELNPRREV